MSLLDIFVTALIALRSNFLRTLLTMLGIIIGIASVIALTAAGEGAQEGVADRIRGLGSNLMFVRPYSAQPAGGLASVLPGAGPASSTRTRTRSRRRTSPGLIRWPRRTWWA